MMVPGVRTAEYGIWRACESLGIRPPGLKESAGWDDLSPEMKAKVLAYYQTREKDNG